MIHTNGSDYLAELCRTPAMRLAKDRDEYFERVINDIAPPISKMSARTTWTAMKDQYYNYPIETETMNTTTVEVKTTERTADDIGKAIRAGKYITNNGSFIVSSGYNSISVAANPLCSRGWCGRDDKSLIFSEDTLTELTSILNIVTADRKISSAEDTKEWAVDSLNIEAKGK